MPKLKIERQQGQSDCGVACLASVIKYYGGEFSLEKLRELSGTSKQGTSLLGLYQAAKAVGFEVEGFEANSVEDLKAISGPAILHVLIDGKMEHYVVFYQFNNGKITIGDPALGLVEHNPDDLERIWNSKALLRLVPNNQFVKSNEITLEKKKWVTKLIKNDLKSLLSILAIGIVISLLGLSTAFFTQRLIDDILPTFDKLKLLIGIGYLALLLLLRSGLIFLRGLIVLKQNKAFNERLTRKFYNRILRLPKLFFDTRKTGELVSRINDTRKIQVAINILIASTLVDFFLVFSSIGLVFSYSLAIGLITSTFVPIYFLIAYKFTDSITAAQKKSISSYAFVEGHYIDTFQGISSIKGSNRIGFFEKLNERVYEKFQDSFFKLGKLSIRFSLVSEIVGVSFTAVVLLIGSFIVFNKSIKIGELVAIVSLTSLLIPAIMRLSFANIQFQEAKIVFERIFEFVSLKPEYAHGPDDNEIALSRIDVLKAQNISFRFAGQLQLIRSVSFEVKRGEIVALIGESGSGKSTLMQILQKFYLPESGDFEVNGVPWDKIATPNWRNAVGYVPQDIKIFNEDLIFNLCLSDSKEDRERAIELSEYYGFGKYFSKLPQGYATLVGEEGINLSGGQRQLVALARALYNEPLLLLLDEATSAMDRGTERFVLDLLQSLKTKMGIIFVTHRIQAIRGVNRIYILENGVISDSGDPQKLLKT
ncbi:MAG TPA: peptidase domain-containing ABC transporter, partial [Cyclobacteriaceae bacterium]|nr:peptidase domain-containing ABC transporter [Cyclobacteriaceae bacterium]